MSGTSQVTLPEDRALRVISTEGMVVCDLCVDASTPLRRLRGLLGRRELRAGEGLLLRPAWSIHMLFMRFAIDAVFLDRDGAVLRVAQNLRPWRMAAERRARAVLEIPAGEAGRRGIRVGDRLVLQALPGRAEPGGG